MHIIMQIAALGFRAICQYDTSGTSTEAQHTEGGLCRIMRVATVTYLVVISMHRVNQKFQDQS